MKRHLNYV
uniref:Uncharacterized protein n=1 Tax=Anguilla anguilla TaxID=7936 RepID=A0A0E9VNS2_ANGAN